MIAPVTVHPEWMHNLNHILSTIAHTSCQHCQIFSSCTNTRDDSAEYRSFNICHFPQIFYACMCNIILGSHACNDKLSRELNIVNYTSYWICIQISQSHIFTYNNLTGELRGIRHVWLARCCRCGGNSDRWGLRGGVLSSSMASRR